MTELPGRLPAGWLCVDVSATGVATYRKRIKTMVALFGTKKEYPQWKVYTVAYTGFAGGWVTSDGYGNPLIPGVFPTYLGAIVAIEIELATM